jgi:hypothetical protein
MAAGDGDLSDAKLLLLEGEPTGDADFYAHEGALLIVPTRVVDVRDPDLGRIDELRRNHD